MSSKTNEIWLEAGNNLEDCPDPSDEEKDEFYKWAEIEKAQDLLRNNGYDVLVKKPEVGESFARKIMKAVLGKAADVYGY